ncbi:MAG: anhydro-N-acetylmuramic acid kinase [Candidatus Kapabacteria bacterium]|nr:anhydro-N-acetylmuramic acid kinase [Candidatus Kapabacteria bacterium]
MINCPYWQTKRTRVCGIMTGTSLDGVDVAVCDFWIINNIKHYELIAFKTFDISNQIKSKILDVCSQNILISDVSDLNFALSFLYKEAVESLLSEFSILISTIDCFGVHGQTVWHSPIPKKIAKFSVSSTLQLFNGSSFAKLINKPVIYDFRSADIALGGNGAPLIPIFDFEFFASDEEDVVFLNIGGVSNVTYLPKGKDKNKVKAWDTGPGNILIDFATNHFYNQPFDKNGEHSLNGNVNYELFDELKSISFIKTPPPKSTGRELFSKSYFESLVNKYIIEPDDFLSTFSYFTAYSIAENIRLFANRTNTIIASGGGIHNQSIMNNLKIELPNANIKTTEHLGLNPDAKEAVCFAFLAFQFLCGFKSNIISVTGASEETILGVLAL